jgi:hypothetical protein
MAAGAAGAAAAVHGRPLVSITLVTGPPVFWQYRHGRHRVGPGAVGREAGSGGFHRRLRAAPPHYGPLRNLRYAPLLYVLHGWKPLSWYN